MKYPFLTFAHFVGRLLEYRDGRTAAVFIFHHFTPATIGGLSKLGCKERNTVNAFATIVKTCRKA